MKPDCATDGLPMPRRLVAITAISFGSALTVIDGAIANVALPTIAKDLGTGSSAAVLIVTIYQLVLVMTLLPFSSLGDRVGLRNLYQWGQLLFTVSALLCFFAKSLPFLLVLRAFQALGAAMALSVSSALLRNIYPSGQLGRGLGVNSVIVSSAAALSPVLGGLIVANAPWPWVFAAAVPFGCLSLLLGRSLPDQKPRKQPYDYLSALMSAATFGLIIGGMESTVHGDSPVVSVAIILGGVFIAVKFVQREVKSPRPIMPVDLLRSPVMALSSLGGLTAFTASMILLLSLPFRLEHGYGFSPGMVGTMLAPWALTMMIVAPLAGYLSDRYPAGLLGGIGMIIAIAGLLCFAWVPHAPTRLDIVWRMSLTALGFGLFMAPNSRLIVGSAPRHRAAAAGGLISTNRLTGQTLGATLAAILLGMNLGDGRAPPLVAACLAAVAGICSFARLNPALRRPDPREVETAEAGPDTDAKS